MPSLPRATTPASTPSGIIRPAPIRRTTASASIMCCCRRRPPTASATPASTPMCAAGTSPPTTSRSTSISISRRAEAALASHQVDLVRGQIVAVDQPRHHHRRMGAGAGAVIVPEQLVQGGVEQQLAVAGFGRGVAGGADEIIGVGGRALRHQVAAEAGLADDQRVGTVAKIDDDIVALACGLIGEAVGAATAGQPVGAARPGDGVGAVVAGQEVGLGGAENIGEAVAGVAFGIAAIDEAAIAVEFA